MTATIRPIQIGAIIIIIILIAGGGYSLGAIFGGKTTTITSLGSTQTYTTTTSTTVTTTSPTTTTATTSTTFTSTLTVTGIPNQVNASIIFAEAEPSVVQVNVYDSGLNLLDLGSGFVYDSLGHVVTNNHVVSAGTYFVIQTYDGRWINATLKGTDQYADLAVLEADTPLSLKPLNLASSVTVGEPAFAIGSPFGLQGSITSGIVSQVNRTGITAVPMLQTDAAINPGNSGGPLLNAAGEVIGINTAGIPSNTSELIGFAIPYMIMARVVPQLIESGRYDHPLIGIGGDYLDPISAKYYSLPSSLTYGYIITSIVSGSSASRSGLRVGDVIIKIDSYNIRKDPDINYLMTYIYSPNQSVTFTIVRNGDQVQVALTLGTR